MNLHNRRRAGNSTCYAPRRSASLTIKRFFPAFALVCLNAALPGGATALGQAFPTPALMDRPPQLLLGGRGSVPRWLPRLPMLSGSIYPQSGFLNAFEVDSPLEAGSPLPSSSGRYFAFRFVFRYTAGQDISFAWQRGPGPEIPFRVVSGPCTGPSAEEQRRVMNGAARRWTGREGVAAYDNESRALLRVGLPLTWRSCEPADGLGEPVVPAPPSQNQPPLMRPPSYAFSRFVFLIPEEVLRGGGNLKARMKDADGSLSAPAIVSLRRAGVSVGVVGDSVAWGQGVMDVQKAGFQLYLGMINNADNPIPSNSRFFMAAHSGATIRTGNARDIADIGDDSCERDAKLDGEVPRPGPSVQCQVRRLAQTTCRVAEAEPGTVAVPRFFCNANDPQRPSENFIEYRFDEGPRWDIVVATGCINDIGALGVVLGTGSTLSIDALRDEIARRCNLRNGLRDLRAWLPNAQVLFMQYHRPITTNSDLANTGCGPFATLPGTMLEPFDFMPILKASHWLAREVAASRSSVFQHRSFEAQTAAATAMNDDARNVGRGTIRTVDMSDLFNRFSGFMAPPNASQLWPLTCSGGQVMRPVDTVRGTRPGPCSEFFNPNGDLPNTTDEEVCLRASAAHPHATANTQMAVRLRGALTNARMLPPPY